MLNFAKFIEILISIQSLFISTMIPVFITLPITDKFKNSIEIPITLQIPTVILLTLLFKRKVVFTSLTIYLLLGLFVAPIFHEGGSLGYLLTPNFGYLLGIYPLIRIIDNLNDNNKLSIHEFIKKSILAICFLHITGLIYTFILNLSYDNLDRFLYIFGSYSIGKIGYHILMLLPIALIIRPLIYIRNRK